MRYFVAAAALVLVASAGAGRYGASISVSDQTPNTVTFAVEQTKGKATSLWVSHVCYVNGQQAAVSAENLPEVDGAAGPFAVAGDYCRAYVWVFDVGPFTPVSEVIPR